MAAVASSDRILTSFPELETADLLGNLSLDPKTNTEAPDTGSKTGYGGNDEFFGQLGTDQVSLSAKATKGSNPSALQNGGGVHVNKGSNQKKLGYQNSSINPKGSYAKAAYPARFYSPSYQYPSGNFGSGNNNFHGYQYMNSHQARMSALGQSYGYMDNIYPNHAMYGHLMNALGTGYGYESYVYDSWKHGQGWYASNSSYKTRNYGFKGYEKENIDGLNELNRGPRASGFKNQEGSQPTNLAAKEQNIPETVNPKENGFLPDTKEYDRDDFSDSYVHAKFFVIKSYSEDDIHKSIKYNVWSSTLNGNKKLDAAYGQAKEKSDGCPVFLLFSVNASGQFVGLAEMVGPVDFNKTLEYWQQDKWIGCFPVKWHIIKDVPNSTLRHITLENNENKPVTNSRDTQEVHLEQGIKIIKIFKDHTSKTRILDDFAFYEARQKLIQEKKAKQQQFKKQGFDGKPGLSAASDVKDDDTASKDDQLQKSKEIAPQMDAEVEGEVNGQRMPLKESGSAVAQNGVTSNGAATAC